MTIVLLTIYHIKFTLTYANRACGVCGRYHMTDGRHHNDCGSIVYQLQSLFRRFFLSNLYHIQLTLSHAN